MTDRVQTHPFNILFVCLIVERYAARFEQNGAVVLNNLLQERGEIGREEAFALIADALDDGFLVFDRENGKCLSVNRSKYAALRDQFVDQVPMIQSQVVSERWMFRQPLRSQLTEKESLSLDKNVRLGRIKEVDEAMNNARPESNVVGYFEQVMKKNCPQRVCDPPLEMREGLIQVMKEPVGNLAKMFGDQDFVFMVEKKGAKIIPKLKVIKRDSSDVDIDWSQV